MIDFLNKSIDSLNSILWENILIYMLCLTGLFFTFKTRFIQFRWFYRAINTVKGSRVTETSSQVSAFQAFCTSLAARIGTGNLAGVAVALTLGGPGAIFWMWVVALIGMSTAMVENILAQLYKIDNGDGTYRGGPAYYMEKALGCRWLGIAFSLAMLLSYGIAFNGVQANSISMAMKSYGVGSHLVGIILAIFSGILIIGGIKTIVRFAELAVPFMALAYILLAIFIILINIELLPSTISLIIQDAFNFKNAAAGGIGAIISPAMLLGAKRGMFSNEAGMGSSPNAAATAYSNHPVNQGMLGMIGVFVDTMLVCSSTGFIIIISGVLQDSSAMEGIQLTQSAVATQVGSWGKHLISVAIFLFAFTSIIANYYYGESAIRFLKNNKYIISVYKMVVILVIYFGCISGLRSVWALADVSMGLMAIMNLVTILLLYKTAMNVIKDYKRQLQEGKTTPVFKKKNIPEIADTISKNVW